MPFTDPYPGKPVSGDLADAAVLLAKFNAIFTGSADIRDDFFTDSASIQARRMAAAFLEKIGVSGPTTVRRGVVSIDTQEVRSSASYGTLTTPDQVSSVSVPANSLLLVGYHAIWASSIASAGRAAIFVGANQLRLDDQSGFASPVVQEAATGTGGNDTTLSSAPFGLTSVFNVGTSGPVTTGQALAAPNGLGGLCAIFNLAAGTYNVSVQYKASSGNVQAKKRRLYVVSLGF